MNRTKGRNTLVFIDEIYLLFQHEYSANFLFTLWKRARKYGAYCTGITQSVDDLFQSFRMFQLENIGLRKEGVGKTKDIYQNQVILFSLIGKWTERLTMLE